MDPIKRKDASLLGLTHYFTGKACGQGHVAKRYVSTGNCTACHASHVRKDREAIVDRRPGIVIAKNVMMPKKWVSEINAVIRMYMEVEGLAPPPIPEITERPQPRSMSVEQARIQRLKREQM